MILPDETLKRKSQRDKTTHEKEKEKEKENEDENEDQNKIFC